MTPVKLSLRLDVSASADEPNSSGTIQSGIGHRSPSEPDIICSVRGMREEGKYIIVPIPLRWDGSRIKVACMESEVATMQYVRIHTSVASSQIRRPTSILECHVQNR